MQSARTLKMSHTENKIHLNSWENLNSQSCREDTHMKNKIWNIGYGKL